MAIKTDIYRREINMTPVKTAMIGNLHDHASFNFTAMSSHPEVFEIIGVSELTTGKDEALYANYPHLTLDELLNSDEIEAVVIEAGKEYEIEYARLFAEKGIPVFLDKPGSSDIPRFEEFIEIAKTKRLPIGFGYMYRFNPIVQKAQELLRSGELGEIYSVEAQMSVRHDTAKREWLGRYKGGAMFYLGCHLVDMVCQFMGFPDEIIPLSRSTGNEGISSEDFGCAILTYKKGISYIKTCSSEYNGYDRRQLVICGTKGTVEIRPWEIPIPGGQITRAKITLASDAPNHWADSANELESEVHDRYYPMLEHFAKTVRGEASMLMSYDYELELFKTLVRACGAENEVFLEREIL